MNLDTARLRTTFVHSGSQLRSPKLLAAIAALIILAIGLPMILSQSGQASGLAPLPPTPKVLSAQPLSSPDASRPSVSSGSRRAADNPRTDPAHNPFRGAASPSKAGSGSTRMAGTSTSAVASASTSAGANVSTTATAGGSAGAAQVSTLVPTSGASGLSASPGTPAAGASSTGPVVKTVTVTTPAVTHTVTTPAAPASTSPEHPVSSPLPYSAYRPAFTLAEVGASAPPTSFDGPQRYQLIPADNDAFAAFLGVRTDEKTAVFVLGSGVTATGQGRCAPSATRCNLLVLTPGQSVLLQTPAWAGGGKYRLRYAGTRFVTSSASLADVDQRGRAVITRAQKTMTSVRESSYARRTGLLSIVLSQTFQLHH